jgi:hypothetical protein
MKKEYEEKLELAKKALAKYIKVVKLNPMSHQSGREFFLEGFRFIEELIRTQDIEVLCALFDFFTEETEYDYDICETLEDLIRAYSSEEQILQVLHQTFDSLAEKNPERCAYIIPFYFFYEESDYERFRGMFNTVRSKHSIKIIEKLKKRLKNGTEWINKEKDRVHTLEEDMKSW